MKDYQHDFIDFAISAGVLRFGEFTLKSGSRWRQRPVLHWLIIISAISRGALTARKQRTMVKVATSWVPACPAGSW
jgi:hypothetical protein